LQRQIASTLNSANRRGPKKCHFANIGAAYALLSRLKYFKRISTTPFDDIVRRLRSFVTGRSVLAWHQSARPMPIRRPIAGHHAGSRNCTFPLARAPGCARRDIRRWLESKPGERFIHVHAQ
jgi:hypothetical protein